MDGWVGGWMGRFTEGYNVDSTALVPTFKTPNKRTTITHKLNLNLHKIPQHILLHRCSL
jgi:hypothetical protein